MKVTMNSNSSGVCLQKFYLVLVAVILFGCSKEKYPAWHLRGEWKNETPEDVYVNACFPDIPDSLGNAHETWDVSWDIKRLRNDSVQVVFYHEVITRDTALQCTGIGQMAGTVNQIGGFINFNTLYLDKYIEGHPATFISGAEEYFYYTGSMALSEDLSSMTGWFEFVRSDPDNNPILRIRIPEFTMVEN